MISILRTLGWAFIAVLFIVATIAYAQYIDRYGFDLTALKGIIAGLIAGSMILLYLSIRPK